MELNSEDIRRMAQLARLEIDESHLLERMGEIGDLLEHVATLANVDTTGCSDDRAPLRRWPDEPSQAQSRDLVVLSDGFRPGENGDQFVRVPTVVAKGP